MKKKKTTVSNVVTIGPKHQVVIPKGVRRQCAQFKKGAKVYVYPLDDQTITVRIVDENWAQAHRGGLKDIWGNIDVMKELKKMREEWDD